MDKITQLGDSYIFAIKKQVAVPLALIAIFVFGIPFFEGTKIISASIIERVNCSYFKSFKNGYELAQRALPTNPRLDADKDGRACEALKH